MQVFGVSHICQYILLALQQYVEPIAKNPSIQRHGDHAQFTLAHKLKTLWRGGHHIHMCGTAADLMNIAAFVSDGGILKVGLEAYGIKSRSDKSACMCKVRFILYNIHTTVRGNSAK
ncbi:hypothetical protein Bwad002_02760 [Bilophila wadsworthia]